MFIIVLLRPSWIFAKYDGYVGSECPFVFNMGIVLLFFKL